MKIEGSFKSINFPKHRFIVYVIGLKKDGCVLPFYVGETHRHMGRVGDYISAQPTAPTDFNVGTVVAALMQRDFQPVFLYKDSSASKTERTKQERELKRCCRELGYRLVDDVVRTREFRQASQQTKVRLLERFAETLVGDYQNSGEDTLQR